MVMGNAMTRQKTTILVGIFLNSGIWNIITNSPNSIITANSFMLSFKSQMSFIPSINRNMAMVCAATIIAVVRTRIRTWLIWLAKPRFVSAQIPSIGTIRSNNEKFIKNPGKPSPPVNCLKSSFKAADEK